MFLGFLFFVFPAFGSEKEFYDQLTVILEAQKKQYHENPEWESKIKIYQSILPQMSKFFNLMGENLAYSGRTRTVFYGMASAYADVFFAVNFLEKKITAPIFEQIIGEKLKKITEKLYQGLNAIFLRQMAVYPYVGAIEKKNRIDGVLKEVADVVNKAVIQSDKHESVNKYFCIGYVLAYQFVIAYWHYLDNEEYSVSRIISYLQNEIYFAKENQLLKNYSKKDSE